MPRKGMRSIFFKASSPPSSHHSSPTRSTYSSSPLHHTFSESLMEENIENAQSMIANWDFESSTSAKVTSLFHEDRREAKEYLKCVKNLQNAMHFFVADNSSSDKLVRAQNLMQIAMKRLEKEFYQILSSNRDYLDAESVSSRSSRASTRSSVSDTEDEVESEDELRNAGESISEVERVSSLAMSDLKAIADCMISSGYGKECVKIYKIIRKSIIDEGLYNIGVERLSFSQVQKMDWEVVEPKIKNWLNALKIAVNTLFHGERILCDHVFQSSVSIRESCFAEISREGAIALFGFPEMVAKCKKSPEKMFRTLDLYETISDLWPEIQSIFSFESTSAVRTQAITSLIKLGEAVRIMLTDFEAAISKDSSKSTVPGGGVHPLTRYVMNYVAFLADYSGILADIVADWPLNVQSPLPESYFESSEFDENPASAISVRLAWLILVLLCKLDGKTELYKDASLSYLFLANNLQYVVVKVRSSNLRYLLGDEWVTKHDEKVKQYAANYERMGWSKVLSSLPENPTAEISPETVNECFKKFNSAFEEAHRKQTSWIVTDPKLRDEIKVSVAKKIVPVYRAFYEKFRVTSRRGMGFESVVRFAPDDLDNYLSDLFYGTGVLGSTLSSSSSSPSSFHSRGRRSS
ncbi:hypothetical protein L1049_013827 [Liquidambar formosana]|uniref:Exocyst subunit Exo70 family protein n=1 Tax=Liquidambar formosana TaxID=63359 RepID=A0AAP0RM43_LIQFO